MAVTLLVRLAEDTSTFLAKQLPHLREMKGNLDRTGTQFDDRDARIAKLEKQVLQLQQERRKERNERAEHLGAKERREQQLLLGQMAYTLNNLVESYVFGPASHSLGFHPTLNDLAAMAKRPAVSVQTDASEPSLTAEQKVRWKGVEQKLATVQPVSVFLGADKTLRSMRYKPAHGYAEEHRGTTLQQLLLWAASHCDSVSLAAVKNVAILLSQFSTLNRPLNPNKRASEVFQT